MLIRPYVTAAAFHADCKVGDKTDPHPGLAHGRLCYAERPICEPLQKRIKGDLVYVACCKSGDTGFIGRREFQRPRAPSGVARIVGIIAAWIASKRA